MMPSPKIQLAIVIVGAIAATIQLWLKHRQAIELREKESQAQKDLAKERAESAERAARHAGEAAAREEGVREREAERQQKEKMIAQLQKSHDDLAAILRAELASQEKRSEHQFELLDRNTRATEALAQSIQNQAHAIAALQAGAGCRGQARSS